MGAAGPRTRHVTATALSGGPSQLAQLQALPLGDPEASPYLGLQEA